MKFWRDNRLDAEFELAPARVVELFHASAYWRVDWPLERSMRAFITDADGPISAVWDDDEAFEEILRLSLDAGWIHGA